MGGLGTLKYAFKYPHLFAGAAAQQPAMVCGDDATVLPLEIDQMATNSEDNIETYGAATMADRGDRARAGCTGPYVLLASLRRAHGGAQASAAGSGRQCGAALRPERGRVGKLSERSE